MTQKGITSLKQYMSLKPINRGIKLWCRADSITGYLCAFGVYTGKQPSSSAWLGLHCCVESLGKHDEQMVLSFFTISLLLENLWETCTVKKHFVVELSDKTERDFPVYYST